jgi:hypothetical protein
MQCTNLIVLFLKASLTQNIAPSHKASFSFPFYHKVTTPSPTNLLAFPFPILEYTWGEIRLKSIKTSVIKWVKGEIKLIPLRIFIPNKIRKYF